MCARRSGTGTPSILALQPGSQVRVRTRRDGVGGRRRQHGVLGLVGEEASGRPAPRRPGPGKAGPLGKGGDESGSPGVEPRRSQGLERLVVGRDPGVEREERPPEGALHVVSAETFVLAGRTEAPGVRGEGGENVAYVQEPQDADRVAPGEGGADQALRTRITDGRSRAHARDAVEEVRIAGERQGGAPDGSLSPGRALGVLPAEREGPVLTGRREDAPGLRARRQAREDPGRGEDRRRRNRRQRLAREPGQRNEREDGDEGRGAARRGRRAACREGDRDDAEDGRCRPPPAVRPGSRVARASGRNHARAARQNDESDSGRERNEGDPSAGRRLSSLVTVCVVRPRGAPFRKRPQSQPSRPAPAARASAR